MAAFLPKRTTVWTPAEIKALVATWWESRYQGVGALTLSVAFTADEVSVIATAPAFNRAFSFDPVAIAAEKAYFRDRLAELFPPGIRIDVSLGS